MAKQAMMMRQGVILCPVDSVDREVIGLLKSGQPYKVEIKSQSDRSLKHHRLFYGGLVRMAMDYYEPTGGLVTSSEKAGARSFAKFLSGHGVDKETMNTAYKGWLAATTESRKARIESPPMTIDSFVAWLKVEAGHYEIEQTPAGIRKVPKSINFNAMSQSDFNGFYANCFGVVWRLVLSRHYDNESDAQSAINQLLEMG